MKFTKLNMLINLKILKIRSKCSIFTTPGVKIHLIICLNSKILKKKLGVSQGISRLNLKKHKKV